MGYGILDGYILNIQSNLLYSDKGHGVTDSALTGMPAVRLAELSI